MLHVLPDVHKGKNMGVLFKVYFEERYDHINFFLFTKSWGSNVFPTLLWTRFMNVMVNVEVYVMVNNEQGGPIAHLLF